MTDQDLRIELEPDDTQGHATFRVTDDEGWLKDRLGRDPGSVRISLKASDEDDVEGHGIGTSVTLRAFEGDDDTEGHAISVHFPSRTEADAFRRRLMLTGVLAGTIAVGAAAGIGLSNLSSDSPADSTVISAGAAAGAGMDWTQAERPDAAATGSGAAAGMDWTQVERPGTATGGDAAADLGSDKRGPTPR
ncbi:MAG TPA: hypothetical protein VF365_10915 [Candidatus Limnocylindria bacterium]